MWKQGVFGRRLRRSESGVILVMAVPGLILAMVCTALSVDIGRQVFEKRRDQSVADAAALDASRDPANAQALAVASAARNGFDDAANVVARRGTFDSTGFHVDATGDAVSVSVKSAIDYIFAPGRKELIANAVARAGARAGFSIGTTLATVDLSKNVLLNTVLGSMLKGTAAAGGTANIVGWRDGLVGSYVTLAALQEQLVTAGVQAGTLDELLAADVTMAQVAQATANALTQQGDLAGAALYSGGLGIVTQATSTATFKLGDIVEVEQGSGDAALAGQLNAFQLLTATALAANGTNAVSIPTAALNVPGVSSATLGLTVIEGPKWVYGPKGVSGSTAQVTATLNPTIDLDVLGLVSLLSVTKITGNLPMTIGLAGATGTLTDIRCPGASASPGISVGVDLKAAGGTAAATLQETTLGVTGSFSVSGAVLASGAKQETLDFSYPGEFSPTHAGKRVTASPINWNASLTQSSGTAGLATALNTTVTSLGTGVLSPVLHAFGLGVGVADVTAGKAAFPQGCKPHPALVE